jgi:hypothetical protein
MRISPLCWLLPVCLLRLSGAEPLPPPEATEQWTPVPPTVQVPAGSAPSDAIILFDGTSIDAWEPVRPDGIDWVIENGAMVVTRGSKSCDRRTKRAFGDVQLHLEFRTPAKVEKNGQGRGNSGILFMGLYEVQVLDSWQNETYVNGQAASIYKQHPPLVNASRAPGEWQVYDIVFIAPRFGDDGQLLAPARITAFHNGVLVHHDAVLRGGTVYRGEPTYTPHPARLPLVLQDHGNPVAFRNIWIRELASPAAAP